MSDTLFMYIIYAKFTHYSTYLYSVHTVESEDFAILLMFRISENLEKEVHVISVKKWMRRKIKMKRHIKI